MPIIYDIPEPATRIHLETTFSGTFTPADVEDYLKGVVALHTSWKGKRAILTFEPDARASGFGYATISRLAVASRASSEALAGSRTAAVAPRALFYGLIRMYLALRDPPYAFEVFRNREPARDWLLRTQDIEAG